MATLPSQSELALLQAFRKPCCASLYVPYLQANGATNPQRIELKDQLKEAEADLRLCGADDIYIKQALRPAQQLVHDLDEFWPPTHESLVLFLHPDLHHIYRLPRRGVAPLVRVGRGFEVRPLIDALAANQEYAVLVLDHRATQLYVGDRYFLAPAHLKGFPADMAQTLNVDEFPSSRELHGIAPAYLGKGSEGYHGQYNVAEVDKQLLTEFFRAIDRRLRRYLRQRKLPLLIAGVSYMLPLYRKVNTYTQLLPGELRGSFRRTRLDTLRDRAYAAVSGTPS